MLSMLLCYRPSIHLSVRHTGGSVKTFKVRIMKFAPYGRTIPLVFAGGVSSRNSNGFPRAGHQTREGWEKQAIF